MRRRTFVRVSSSLLFTQLGGASLIGCTDRGKLAQDAASEAVDVALGLTTRDTDQVRKGMPEGVKVLEKRLPADPVGDRMQVEQAIKAARENVDSLINAKSTFFSYAGADGVVLRSEVQIDELAEKNIFTVYPALKQALEPGAGLVEAYGEMDALRGVRKGNDTAWVVAHAVGGGEGGKPRGLFLSGWSLRHYAGVLQLAMRSHFDDKAKGAQKTSEAVHAHVFILKGRGTYGDPEAPDENTNEVQSLDILPKLGSGEFRALKEFDKRTWGIVGKKAPQLGDDAALVGLVTIY
jgi:hypothetical protein